MPNSKTADAAYEPTEKERAALDANQQRWQSKRPCPRLDVKVDEEGSVRTQLRHVDVQAASRLLEEALGTSSWDFSTGILDQLCRFCRSDGKISEDYLNFMLATINGIEPRNEAEAMLALQMAVTHAATMQASGYLIRATEVPQYDSALKGMTKLARTYALQMETLKKYRTGGEQNVTVKHVHVHEGGQAIVGNICTGEGVASKPKEQPHAQPAAITNAPQPEMRGTLQTDRQPLPQRRNG